MTTLVCERVCVQLWDEKVNIFQLAAQGHVLNPALVAPGSLMWEWVKRS